MDWFRNYGKAVPLFLGAVILALRQVTDDGAVSGSGEWLLLIGAFVAAVSTYVVPNLTEGAGKYAKIVTYAATAVVTALGTLLPGGLTAQDWIDLVIVAATALGVVVLPSTQHPANPAVAPAQRAA